MPRTGQWCTLKCGEWFGIHLARVFTILGRHVGRIWSRVHLSTGWGASLTGLWSIMCICFSLFRVIIFILLLPVNITVRISTNKTSIWNIVFFHKMELTLPKCIPYFRSHCLQLAAFLLCDGHQCIGLITPNILSTINYKAILTKMIKWNDLTRYSFFHTYGPDGTVCDNGSINVFSLVTFP